MNKKGFTLVELLAIIVILGIIAVIAGPSLKNQIKNEEDQTQKVLSKKIENASRLYAAKYYAKEIVGAYDSTLAFFSFTLDDLEKDGLLSLKDDECKDSRDKNIEYYNDVINGKIGFSYTNLNGCYN